MKKSGRRVIVNFIIFTVSFVAGIALAQSNRMFAQWYQQTLLEGDSLKETRRTLNPAVFGISTKAAAAYKVAKERPEVLSKLFCYCYCAKNPNLKHKSLLTCYVDTHAVACSICINSALKADKMTKEGASPQKIAESLAAYYLDKKR